MIFVSLLFSCLSFQVRQCISGAFWYDRKSKASAYDFSGIKEVKFCIILLHMIFLHLIFSLKMLCSNLVALSILKYAPIYTYCRCDRVVLVPYMKLWNSKIIKFRCSFQRFGTCSVVVKRLLDDGANTSLSGNGKISSCAAAEGSFTSLTGLLEVEPLHFTCVSTSDGTRIERDDASTFTGIYNFSFFLLSIILQYEIFNWT